MHTYIYYITAYIQFSRWHLLSMFVWWWWWKSRFRIEFVCRVQRQAHVCACVYAFNIPNILGIKNSDNAEIYSIPMYMYWYAFRIIQFLATQSYRYSYPGILGPDSTKRRLCKSSISLPYVWWDSSSSRIRYQVNWIHSIYWAYICVYSIAYTGIQTHTRSHI